MEREVNNPTISTPLIQVCEDNGPENGTEISHGRSEILEEIKKQLWLAGPLISVSLLIYSLQMISVMFVGHLGELSLSGASMATSFASVTGFSLLMGLSSALETLSGQAYGAKQYHMLGIHMQRAMFVLLIVSIPLAVIWANTRSILTLLGQDAEISAEAGQCARIMIPSIFAYGLLQCFIRFLQAQNIIFPMMLSCGITTLIHMILCWILVLKSGLGNRGAALANSISYWINVLLLGLYVKFSSSCAKSWTGFSKESLQNIPTFLKLAIPSAVMVCLNTAATVWMIPFGLSGAVSTRVSNELGAGHPDAARLAVRVVLVMAIIEGLLVGLVLILIRNIWGYAFSNELEVIKYVAIMMPILAVSNFLDGLQCVLSGNARGCGWQKIGAYVNLGSYYLVGIPSAVLLAFVFHIRGKGLWLGIICALVVQVLSLFTITIRTNWEQESKKATERVYDSKIPVDIVS
nr:protein DETOXIFICATION 16-like isoform X2 [Ziziphus jujuba var. spinosa]